MTLDTLSARLRGTADSGPGSPASIARLERIVDVTQFMSALELRVQETA